MSSLLRFALTLADKLGVVGVERSSSRDGTRALRIDSATGTRETFEFFGDSSDRLAGMSYLPASPTDMGLVLCSSIAADFPANYGREVRLARDLCREGVAVQRFHYRGTGHSDGDPSKTTFATMCEDAIEGIENLRAKSAFEVLVVAGTRVGALIATSVARKVGGKRLALIEPVTDPAKFFREGFRARLVHEVKEQRRNGATTKELLEDLLRVGVVDILGYSVHTALYESLSECKLQAELPTDPGRLLIVQFGSTGHVRREYQTLIDDATDQGWTCEFASSPATDSWWLVGDEDHIEGDALLPVADWVCRELERR